MIPQYLYSPGGDSGVRDRRIEHEIKQVPVHHVVLLMEPEALQQMMGIVFTCRVKSCQPLCGCCHHGVRVSLGQFHPRAAANSVDRVLKHPQKVRNRLSVYGHVL